ncbi:MAG: rubrerythrin family protein [Muribaculaceae bacterium]|nr:rubrerythrin family protein [Muribaculaceae bacterium]
MASTKKKKNKSIKGTQTEKNLAIAYMAESAAYTRYTFYAGQAEKEEYFPIQRVFTDTAANEMRHAKVYFKYLEGGNFPVTLGVDAGVIGTTAENLATAAHEEEVEGYKLYLSFAKVAEEEGFDDIASHFRAIAEIESRHRERFLYYLKQVEEGTVWKRDHEITWQCLVCGYEHKGTEPPAECPACDHPYKHYIGLDEPEFLA